MTVICGGNASQPKLGTPAAAYVAGSELAALIAGVFSVPAWIAIAAYAAAQNIVLANLCGTDPPAMPTFNAADIIDLLNQNPLRDSPASAKLNDLLAIAAWYTFCECATVATPAPPAAPTYPPTSPTIGPTQIAPVSAPACWVRTVDKWIWSSGANFPQVLPGNVAGNCNLVPRNFLQLTCINPSAVRFLFVNHADGSGGNDNVPVELRWYNAGMTNLLRNDQFTINSGVTFDTGNLLPPAGWGVFECFGGTGPPPYHQTSMSITATVYCGATPGQPNSPCCPPDPALQAQLDNIFSMLTSIYQSLPAGLNSYASATVHAGLTGNGTVSLVDKTLAIRIDITSDTSGSRIDAGSPNFLFDRGYIVPVVNSAPIRGFVRLSYNPQQYDLPPLTEQIGYTLPAGVTIKITELVRGP